ncbi:MAG TPA: arginine N-succinyltransferase, partial [Marinobacter sp.]|nr:arginine N-succinyltransferase [Marinobacter sp.]
MWLVRPVTAEDIEPILVFAETHTRALPSTLPHEREALAGRIKESNTAFAGEHSAKHPARFLFVLEQVKSHEIKGIAGIDARAGNGEPFDNCRRDALIHASYELGISQRVDVLYPSHSL